jgi:hypothetical protein
MSLKNIVLLMVGMVALVACSGSAAIDPSKIAFAGSTIPDLGTVTTVDLNGGQIDGTAIGSSSASTAKVTTLEPTAGIIGVGGNALSKWDASSFVHKGPGSTRIERTGTASSSSVNILTMRATTTANMVDGFGARLRFETTDNGAAGQYLGDFAYTRAGADNTGAFDLRTASGGSPVTRLRIDNSGKSTFFGAIASTSATDSTSPTTGSIVTVGGVGIGKSLEVGDSLSVGSNALTSGAYGTNTVEFQNVPVFSNVTLFANVGVASGTYHAFTLSVITRLTGAGPAGVQQDLYWITANGATVTITALATDSGGTGGLAYTITKVGNDLVYSHIQFGRTADVVAAISGLQSVTP